MRAKEIPLGCLRYLHHVIHGKFGSKGFCRNAEELFCARAEIEFIGKALQLGVEGAAQDDERFLETKLWNIDEGELQDAVHELGFGVQHFVDRAPVFGYILDDFLTAVSEIMLALEPGAVFGVECFEFAAEPAGGGAKGAIEDR